MPQEAIVAQMETGHGPPCELWVDLGATRVHGYRGLVAPATARIQSTISA